MNVRPWKFRVADFPALILTICIAGVKNVRFVSDASIRYVPGVKDIPYVPSGFVVPIAFVDVPSFSAVIFTPAAGVTVCVRKTFLYVTFPIKEKNVIGEVIGFVTARAFDCAVTAKTDTSTIAKTMNFFIISAVYLLL